MLRNYLTTALRNLVRNRLYAAISIVGLAIALASAVLIIQFVRHEFSYDRWVPGYRNIYLITHTMTLPGEAPALSDATQSSIGARLKLAAASDVVATARLVPSLPLIRRSPTDEGNLEQAFAWADPLFFTVFPLPALAGEPKQALEQPDTVVITRRMARKYFSKDFPVGESLLVEGKLMKVTAVLKDLPANTNLTTEIYASGRATTSPLSQLDAAPPLTNVSNLTFVRLSPTATKADLLTGLRIAERPFLNAFDAGGVKFTFDASTLPEVHMQDFGLTMPGAKPAGNKATTLAIALVAALIIIVAAINFVTLMTARAARRAVEVGVRKASGAKRKDLIIQFTGEALLQATLSMLIALPLALVLLKPFSAFIQRDLTIWYILDPVMLISLALLTLAIGILAGFYPALVLSSFRPAVVLKGGPAQFTGSNIGRQALVVVQFTVLVGLIVTTITIYRQTQFALKQGMGAEGNQIVQIRTNCSTAFPQEVRNLSGVSLAACSSRNALNTPNTRRITQVRSLSGRVVTTNIAPVFFDFFEVYDIRPLAGRVFQRNRGGDDAVSQRIDETAAPPVVINEKASRSLGYRSPQAAIGQHMLWEFGDTQVSSEIIGVVPDMPVTVRSPTDPTFYYVDNRVLAVLSAKLKPENQRGTIQQLEKIWKSTGNTRPFQLVYFSAERKNLYLNVIIQGVVIAVSAIMAILIACLGLFALSAFTIERRTKEIGVRKVMGAKTHDVVKLLIWQFTLPVLVAIAIALPVTYLLMERWLEGFAYHLDMSPWVFLLSASAALAIAWSTVSLHTFNVARANPISALRYE